MVRPQERLQIALVVRAAFRQWNAMIYFVGGIEQETAALWVLRVDTAACTPPLLRSRDLFGLEDVTRFLLAAVGAEPRVPPWLGCGR